MITRRISECLAAPSQANCSKSRGPVAAWGKANSSRNSFRHLRNLDLIHRLESRFPDQSDRALDRQRELHAWSELEVQFAAKLNVNERTREVIENTAGKGTQAKIPQAKQQKLPNEPNNSLKTSHCRPQAAAGTQS
jgi:hypothetical protein